MADLTFEYDSVGDILYIETVAPYAKQESDEVESWVVVREDPKMTRVESIEILFFMERLKKHGSFRIPVEASFHRTDLMMPLPRLPRQVLDLLNVNSDSASTASTVSFKSGSPFRTFDQKGARSLLAQEPVAP